MRLLCVGVLKKKKKRNERKKKEMQGKPIVEKNGASALKRRWIYQTTSVSCKILGGYSIQREEHSYRVPFLFQRLDFRI